MTTTIYSLTGPTCAGKTTLYNHLMTADTFSRIIGYAGRAPRPGERDGVDYHFRSNEEIKAMIDAGETAEHVHFRGNYYCISKQSIHDAEKTGKLPLLILEPSGLEHFKQEGYDIFSVYIGGSRQELIRRFLSRLSGDVEYDSRRLDGMLREIDTWPNAWEYSWTITEFSDNLQSVVDEICDIAKKYAKEKNNG